MVDISSIGKNLNLDAATTAGAAQSAGAGTVETKKLLRKRPLEGQGLGLEDIPEQSPYVPVQDAAIHEDAPAGAAGPEAAAETAETAAAEEAEPVYSEEENSAMLDKIDLELATVQAMLKKILSKKIAAAAKTQDAELKHKILASAFDDCKNAHVKLREVRDFLG